MFSRNGIFYVLWLIEEPLTTLQQFVKIKAMDIVNVQEPNMFKSIHDLVGHSFSLTKSIIGNANEFDSIVFSVSYLMKEENKV